MTRVHRRMSETQAAESLRPYLAPGERLEWSDVGGPMAVGPKQRVLEFLNAAGAATLITVLAGIDGVLPGPALPVLFLAVFAVALFAVRFFIRRAGNRPRIYGITDRRVVVLEDGALQSFGSDHLAALEVEAHKDGSHDLFWGRKVLPARAPYRDWLPEGGLRIWILSRQRHERIGFVGLTSPEPAEGLLRDWLRRRYDAAAKAAMPAPDARTVADVESVQAAGGAEWRTVREPSFGFAIDVPAAWLSRVGLLKRTRVLGIRIESPEPEWFDEPGAGWNRLEVKAGFENAILQVDLDPPDPPADLDAVRNDPWSNIVNVKLLDARPDVRLGGLVGFAVVQSLKGAGLGVGRLRIGGSLKADLVQTQFWLRARGRSIHVIHVTPAEATVMRAAMEKVVATVRLE